MRASWPLIRNKLPLFRHHEPDNGIIQQRPKHVDSKNNCIISEVSRNMITLETTLGDHLGAISLPDQR